MKSTSTNILILLCFFIMSKALASCGGRNVDPRMANAK